MLEELDRDIKELTKVLKANGFPDKLINAIKTRALRSGRRQTGVFKSNRHSRWTLIHDHPEHGTDPQYGTEEDCKIILIRLLLTTLEFLNAPRINDTLIEEWLAEPRRRVAEAGLEVEVEMAHGDVAEEILRRARAGSHGLLAMTTHGRSGVSRWWFGSVAEALVRHAPCPLFVLRVED